jgi:hypothetical protein
MKSPNVLETPDSTLVYIPRIDGGHSEPTELFVGSLDDRPLLKRAGVVANEIKNYGNLIHTARGNIFLPRTINEHEAPALFDLEGEHPLIERQLGAFTLSSCGANYQILKSNPTPAPEEEWLVKNNASDCDNSPKRMREVQDLVWAYGASFKSRRTRQRTWFRRASGSMLGPTKTTPVQIGRSVNYKLQLSDTKYADIIETRLRHEGVKIIKKISNQE